MKRTIALFLSVCLLLGISQAFAVEPVNINLYTSAMNGNSIDSKSVNSMANLGDTLYVRTNSTLESWKPGDTNPTVLLTIVDNQGNTDETDEAQPTDADVADYQTLFADTDTLYGLNVNTGKVWKLADSAGLLPKPELKVSLLWDTMTRKYPDDETSTYSPQISDIALDNGVFYLAVIDWNESTQPDELIRWNFGTGELIGDQKGLLIRSMTPYKDGLLLCKLYDEVNSWDETTQKQKVPALGTYNPATGEIVKLFDFDDSNIYGLRYSASADALYYISGSVVYSYPGVQQPAKISAYFPNSVWDGSSYCLLPSSMYAVGDYNGLVVRGLDQPGIENGALTIYGEYGSSGHQAYLTAYPQASVTCSDKYFNNLEDFTNAMVSGTNAVDVLRIDSDYSPLTRLIDKGYALDLSPYADLVGYVSAMDPNLTSICQKDGKFYAIPVDLYASTITYNQETWKSLGLTDDDLPTNLMELMDFIANWDDDYGEDHPELRLLDNGDVQDTLLNWIMSNYVAYLSKTGQSLSFDTDLFRKIMTKYGSLDFKTLDENTGDSDEDYWSRTGVFSLFYNITSPQEYRNGNHFLLIPLDEGLEPVIPATLQVMFINPRTTHLEQAVQYLTTYVQNLDQSGAMITLFPDHNDAVINPYYESDLASWKETLETDTKLLETAKPEDKASIQADIDYFNNLIKNSEDDKYTVSAKEIATYREMLAPYLTVVGQTALNVWGDDGNNEFYTQETQYIQGAITMDQFIKEIDKRMRMMQLEDQ